MTLYSLAVRRPVLTVVGSILIVLFGLIGYSFLGVREFPSVEPPVITVTTNYRGANADVIESQVTEPLENAVNGIDGIRSITSTSREGRSSITVEFQIGADLERATNDVRDRVFGSLGSLPPDIDPPQVSKSDADSQPIVQLAVSSPQRDLMDLTRFARDVFVERLQTIPGVARAEIWGEQAYAMRLWLDPRKLAAYQLSPLDVRDALTRENVELPSGRIEGQSVELPVRTMSRLNTPEEFEDLILKQEAGRTVRLRDVGRAQLGPRNVRTVLKNDGVPMVAIALTPQPGANSIDIIDEFYRRLANIERDLPPDIQTQIGFDTTRYIRRSISEVRETIFLALGLVTLIIFLFLRDWRTTLIPVVVIPVSLVGTFFILYLYSFSINVLTLLGIVLAIGMVVDDAIIVLENIYAKVEAGAQPIQAAIAGTKEIFLAVVATTFALAAVFLPVLFIGGLTGQLFREFGVTIAGSVVISAVVALTLTPMLGSRLLKKRTKQPWFYRATEPFFRGLASGYRSSLEAFLRVRWLAPLVLLGAVWVILHFWDTLPKEVAPLEDRGMIRLSSRAQEGATFSYMDAFTDQLINLVRTEVPERATLISVTAPGFGASSSVNSSSVRVILKDTSERSRSQQQIAAALSQGVRSLPGARTFVSEEPTIAVGRRRGLPIEFVVQAPTIEKLQEVLPRFLDAAADDPTFPFVDVDLKFEKPELSIEIDRERARDLGVSALEIAQTLQVALAEQRLGFFLLGGKQYEVIAQVDEPFRNETFDLSGFYVRGSGRQPIQLDKLITVTEASRPPQLFRFDRWVSATVSASLAPGKTVGDGVDAMRAIASRVLDDSFRTALSGQARDLAESSGSLLFVFLLALALIYLVLAAQFESFRDPFTIMLSVPLAVASALASLWVFGLTINVFSQIGLIMLIGLVTKNGILIVEFANQRAEQGADLRTATLEGASSRLRPVLMTSLSTILGILPIALALGAGAESRVPMGIAVVGGLSVGTLLTLYVVPAMHTYLARRHREAVGPDEHEPEETTRPGITTDAAA